MRFWCAQETKHLPNKCRKDALLLARSWHKILTSFNTKNLAPESRLWKFATVATPPQKQKWISRSSWMKFNLLLEIKSVTSFSSSDGQRAVPKKKENIVQLSTTHERTDDMCGYSTVYLLNVNSPARHDTRYTSKHSTLITISSLRIFSVFNLEMRSFVSICSLTLAPRVTYGWEYFSLKYNSYATAYTEE